MGFTIYTDGNPQLTVSRQAVLWSLSGIRKFAADKGGGQIANAASPAWGLGTVPLAPALLNVVPGSRYLTWVWCWQASRLEGDTFLAFLDFCIPFLTVEAGPQLVIH